VESLSAISVHPFSRAGRCYGLLIAVRGQAYVFGATERGFFYRFGTPIYSPARGRYDSIFALRTRVGGINILFTKWMRNEVLSIHFRDTWIRGYIDISRHGLHSFQLLAADPEIHPQANRQALSVINQTNEGDNINNYQSRHELDCDTDW
jgi:hypothetical protein